MEKMPSRLSGQLFNNQYMASVGAWISAKTPAERFNVAEIYNDLGLVHSLASPVLQRLMQADLVTRYPRMEQHGIVPYSRTDSGLWVPFGAMCRLIVETEVDQTES
jgi:hypothetical protein